MIKNKSIVSGDVSSSSSVSDDDLVCLAEIVATHGIKGAVRLKSFTRDPEDIFNYPELMDAHQKIYKIKFSAAKKNGVFVAIVQGVTTCNDAEILRGTKLYVHRSELPTLQEDEFYYNDLIGMRVITSEGKEIGEVVLVQNHGAGDFFDIRSSAGELFTLLFTKEAVPEVNFTDRFLIVKEEFLLQN